MIGATDGPDGTLGVAGFETSRIGLGTAVTPTYPRHPAAIAPGSYHRRCQAVSLTNRVRWRASFSIKPAKLNAHE